MEYEPDPDEQYSDVLEKFPIFFDIDTAIRIEEVCPPLYSLIQKTEQSINDLEEMITSENPSKKFISFPILSQPKTIMSNQPKTT